jgi:putative FmdB family regulatory protein
MPLYEYECTKCGHRFELIQKLTDKPPKRCPKCKGKLRKLLSAPAIQFKGSGWYVTDYAGKGKGKDKPQDEAKSDPPKSEPAAAKKSPAKPKKNGS